MPTTCCLALLHSTARVPQAQSNSIAHNHYLSFFLGRSWLLCPHFFLRQFVARGGRRACQDVQCQIIGGPSGETECKAN